MRITLKYLSSAIFVSAVCASAAAQTTLPANGWMAPGPATQAANQALATSPTPVVTEVSPAVRLLEDFSDSDIKFDLATLMDILRDHKHEGWVLAAYPDPKTGRPLIGAGFSLDLPARDHPQRDPLNPHPFLEPSSADLWQAAGLDNGRLQEILGEYRSRLDTWNQRRFRNRIAALEPQISDHEANLLLRIAAIQAIYNARAYCRNFDRLTASQQMAMSQLVYQMGVNLEEFSQFLRLINGDGGEFQADAAFANNAERWHAAQQSLMQSQWARLYRVRAAAVIAMLDPAYDLSPGSAERRISATLKPAVVHRHRGHAAVTRELASASTTRSKSLHRKSARARTKRKA